jgi:multicomponent Na+:H+ antiporter subunit G
MSDVIGYTLITLGILFNLFGCVGLVRFPDVYNRLQAGTKCVTLGTVLLLVGVAIVGGGAMAAKAVVCAVFILVTSPTAAHAIAKGAYASGVALWDRTVVDQYADAADQAKPGGEAGRLVN